MDVNAPITLHRSAKIYLYEHYRKLRKIFGDVLGLMEIDYLSIAMINNKNELFFLSSSPSIEYNLIEKNIWQLDKIYNGNFIQQDKAQWWSDINARDNDELYHYKQASQKLMMGLSVPDLYDEYRVIYSFGFQSDNEQIRINIQNNIYELLNIGRFCLKKITKTIPLPDRLHPFSSTKPNLTLITNQVNYERTT